MEETISDLTKSLEFTQAEVHDLKRGADNFKKSNSELQAKIQDYEKKLHDLLLRLNYQEDYSRRNNLRISGLEEPRSNETWEQTSTLVNELFTSKLQLPNMKLERAHRVGPASPSRPRTVVVRFERFGDREAVLRNARKLKGTGVYLNEDLCAASQAIKQSQFPLMKQARLQGKTAYFRYTKLIIKDKTGQQATSGSSGSSGVPGSSAGAASAGPSSRRAPVIGGAGSISCGSPGARTSVAAGRAGTSTVADGGVPAPAWATGAGGISPATTADGDASTRTAGGSGDAGTGTSPGCSRVAAIADGASVSTDNGEVSLEGTSLSSEIITRQKKDQRKGKKK